MPAVCEERGLPYVYTPSRWDGPTIIQFPAQFFDLNVIN
jgi:hypothetical protein